MCTLCCCGKVVIYRNVRRFPRPRVFFHPWLLKRQLLGVFKPRRPKYLPSSDSVFILYANLPHHKWIFPDMAYFNTSTTNHQGFTSPPPPHLYDLLHFSREAADDVRVLLLHVLLTLGTGNDTSINEFFKYISTKHSSGFVKQPSKKRNANGSDFLSPYKI